MLRSLTPNTWPRIGGRMPGATIQYKLIQTLILIYQLHFSVSRMNPSNKFVPPAFISLFKMTVFRLVGSGMLSKTLVNKEFWEMIKNKFSNATAYARRMEKKVFILFSLIMTVLYIFLFFLETKTSINVFFKPNSPCSKTEV